MLHSAFLLTGNRHDAQDLLQTALLAAARRWSRIRRRDQPEPYVRQAMYRHQVNRWRRGARRPERVVRRRHRVRTAGLAASVVAVLTAVVCAWAQRPQPAADGFKSRHLIQLYTTDKGTYLLDEDAGRQRRCRDRRAQVPGRAWLSSPAATRWPPAPPAKPRCRPASAGRRPGLPTRGAIRCCSRGGSGTAAWIRARCVTSSRTVRWAGRSKSRVGWADTTHYVVLAAGDLKVVEVTTGAVVEMVPAVSGMTTVTIYTSR